MSLSDLWWLLVMGEIREASERFVFRARTHWVSFVLLTSRNHALTALALIVARQLNPSSSVSTGSHHPFGRLDRLLVPPDPWKVHRTRVQSRSSFQESGG